MSRFICCVLFFTFCSAAFSQRIYFVYLQSEAEQPFFVKIGEKTYSSTPAGYLFLSQLKDSSYSIKVGFPQNKWPDQQFAIDIRSKDRGYLLKNFGEKGWGLFDLQTMSVQMAVENRAAKKELREVSAFTEILSKAANDPSLKEKPVFAVVRNEQKTQTVSTVVVKQESNQNKQPVGELKTPVKPEENAGNVQSSAPDQAKAIITEKTDSIVKLPVKKEDSLIARPEVAKKEVNPVSTDSQVTVSRKEETKIAPTEVYKKSVVTKRSESSTTDGFGLTFIDQYADGQKDTIRIIIPIPAGLLAKETKPQDDKKFLDITEETKENKPVVLKAIVKNSCSSTGSQNDFLKLRKKMAGQKTEEAMIEEAKRGFKEKCFTTEQIKNLGNLFLNEAGKFQFYEAAYPYSSDRDNFTVLQEELKDNYFIHRFKNLVKPGSL